MFYVFMYLILLNFSELLQLGKCEERSPTDDPPTLGKSVDAEGIHPIAFLLERFAAAAAAKGSEEGGWLPALLTLTDLNSDKLLGYAFNGLISVVHLMTQVLTTNADAGRRRKTRGDSSPFRFLFTRPQVVGLLSQMQDPDIVEDLLTEVEEKVKERPPEEVECVKLLLCKMTPFVRGMQRWVGFWAEERRAEGPERRGEQWRCRGGDAEGRGCPSEKGRGRGRKAVAEEEVLWEKTGVEDRIYFFAPTLEEVIRLGDECDLRFPRCYY